MVPLLIGALTSCSGADTSTNPSNNSPYGLFQLVSIDASAPPAGLSSSFEIRSDDTFTYTERSGSTTTFVSSGSYAFVPASTSSIDLTVLQSNGGTDIGPCATKCAGTWSNGWLLVPTPLSPSSGFGAGWRYK